MSAPQEVLDLVARFTENLAAYASGAYNEAQLRREFIDPLFSALGWDLDNIAGHAEAYKDVIHEDAIRIGGAVKAPDYCFRIGGTRKFFVEAKKPAVRIAEEAAPAYQLRRYAWSAGLPLSILTNFEEFAVYDCRIKPDQNDRPATARILFFNFRDYAARWEEIAAVFTKEAVLKGAFDRYAESTRLKKGTAGVDEAFLREIESWRDLLARTIALRNPALSQRELNTAVTLTINRIIFLRICEDRGIEPYGQLQGLLNGPGVYKRLIEIFQRADDRYNSGLFHFRQEQGRAAPPDRLTLDLAIDDKALKEIFRGLYYPDSPYEFSVLPADILGRVYEQFLGKIIRLTAGHQAKVDDKPEVKKAGGVFYTPKYIVDYIVGETVGRLLEGRTIVQADRLRIIDPACGSGSFLIQAYQRLLDGYRDRYVAGGPERRAKGRRPVLYQAAGGEWRLTTAERKRILLNNIYGVDIDPQAVEVTKLSLLLKVLEGESGETLTNQIKLFQERALPDLSGNIRCGNSLIGPDFYDGAQLTLLGDEDQYRINCFAWEKEFPEIFRMSAPSPSTGKGSGGGEPRGGFDAVIGNPPYIRIQTMKEWAPLEVEFYKAAFAAAGKGNYDIYVVFVEKGLGLLNAKGRLGFILPHKFFNAQYGEALRGLLAEGKHLSGVVHFGDAQVFAGATTYTCLLFLEKAGAAACRFTKVDDLDAWQKTGQGTEGAIPAANVTAAEWNFTVGRGADLFEKLRRMPVKLGDISSIFVGLQTSADTVFLFKNSSGKIQNTSRVYSKALDKEIEIEIDLLKPVIRSGNIGRYWAMPNAQVLFPYEMIKGKAILIPEADLKKRYPKTWGYLFENRQLLSGREHGKFKDTGWYQLYPKNLNVWERPKIMIPYMITNLAAYYDKDNAYFVNVTTGGFGITVEEKSGSQKYHTGLLNSRLLNWFLKNVSTTFHGGYYAANKQFLVQLPIRTIDFTDAADRERHDRMVALVEEMLALHRRLAAARTDHEQTNLKRQIDATDSRIDRLVYDLYSLTEEEIRIVEEKIATKGEIRYNPHRGKE
ncbi:MAG: Eco57I restriction-modification methylase domain-containing protein [Proteobacteria bacterium]|nr:Eco57I restriction-modification methylase domain-containing protein [Pseudomonadota bacterium]